MACVPTDRETQTTALGCHVTRERQRNAHGLEIESVTLRGPDQLFDDDHEPTEDE